MLSRQMSVSSVEILSRQVPTPLKMPNHPSALLHKDEVTKKVTEMHSSGVLVDVAELSFSTEHDRENYTKSLLYIPLGWVIRGSTGKGRPIWDCRYLNCFIPYIPGLKYDSLSTFYNLLKHDDFMVALDQTSSYFHFRLRRDMWRFLAIEWDGRTYLATVLPFGLSLACNAVTDLMGAVWWPLRHHGVRLIYMIDDVGIAESTPHRCAYILKIVALVLSALGFTASFDMCQLVPSHELHLLGFLVDSSKMHTFIPRKKAESALALSDAHLQAGSIEFRQLQSLAGTLLSLAPAVELAPSYIRTLYGALTGIDTSSPSIIEFESDLMGDLQFWKALLSSHTSGRPIRFSCTRIYKVYSDASSIGGGSFWEDCETNTMYPIAMQSWDESQQI